MDAEVKIDPYAKSTYQIHTRNTWRIGMHEGPSILQPSSRVKQPVKLDRNKLPDL